MCVRSYVPKLASLVNSLPSLEKLALIILPDDTSSICARSFKAAKVVLSRVTTLIVGEHCEFLVGMCPNVRVISAKDLTSWNTPIWYRENENAVSKFCKVIRPAHKLVHLEIKAFWTERRLKGEFCWLSSAVGRFLTH